MHCNILLKLTFFFSYQRNDRLFAPPPAFSLSTKSFSPSYMHTLNVSNSFLKTVLHYPHILLQLPPDFSPFTAEFLGNCNLHCLWFPQVSLYSNETALIAVPEISFLPNPGSFPQSWSLLTSWLHLAQCVKYFFRNCFSRLLPWCVLLLNLLYCCSSHPEPLPEAQDGVLEYSNYLCFLQLSLSNWLNTVYKL